MFISTFDALCKERGVNKTQAARDMGLSETAPVQWGKRNSTPDVKSLFAVSNYFNVSLDWVKFQMDYWPIDSWVESQYEDFENLGTIEDKLCMLRHDGTPPVFQNWLRQFEPEKYLSLKNENAFSDEEKTLLQTYRSLNPEGKQLLMAQVELIGSSPNYKKHSESENNQVG